jgi:hypothetical protein
MNFHAACDYPTSEVVSHGKQLTEEKMNLLEALQTGIKQALAEKGQHSPHLSGSC